MNLSTGQVELFLRAHPKITLTQNFFFFFYYNPLRARICVRMRRLKYVNVQKLHKVILVLDFCNDQNRAIFSKF